MAKSGEPYRADSTARRVQPMSGNPHKGCVAGQRRRFEFTQDAWRAGLAPTPWLSGRIQREQGISKSGNSRLRTAMVELAWLWLRNQPASALSRWFGDRVRDEGGRKRRITIVALARKLLVTLWKYVNRGEAPDGAALKPV